MTFETMQDGDTLIITVAGRLDAETAPALDAALANASSRIVNAVFDLEQLEYISSAGLRTLLATYKRTMKAHGSMRVLNASDNVMDVLKLSGFADLYEIE